MHTLTPKHHALMQHCWPGPLTIIFKAKKGIPKFLQSATGTIAIRCPKHAHLQALLPTFKGLFSTSANKGGDPPPKTIKQVDPALIKKIKYLVIDTKSFLLQTLPSSIIDFSRKKGVKVIREGSFPIKTLEKYYGEKFEKV